MTSSGSSFQAFTTRTLKKFTRCCMLFFNLGLYNFMMFPLVFALRFEQGNVDMQSGISLCFLLNHFFYFFFFLFVFYICLFSSFFFKNLEAVKMKVKVDHASFGIPHQGFTDP